MSLTEEESKVTNWMRNDADKWLDACFATDTERAGKVLELCSIIDRLSARVAYLEGKLRRVEELEREREMWKSCAEELHKSEYPKLLEARVNKLEVALETIVGEIDIPDADCHCHIAPPCSDCVEYSHLRDLVTIARQALKKEVK